MFPCLFECSTSGEVLRFKLNHILAFYTTWVCDTQNLPYYQLLFSAWYISYEGGLRNHMSESPIDNHGGHYRLSPNETFPTAVLNVHSEFIKLSKAGHQKFTQVNPAQIATTQIAFGKKISQTMNWLRPPTSLSLERIVQSFQAHVLSFHAQLLPRPRTQIWPGH